MAFGLAREAFPHVPPLVMWERLTGVHEDGASCALLTRGTGSVGRYLYIRVMATFITGIHHCPDCGETHVGSRAFEESTTSGPRIDWCAFRCRNGHIWARPGMQAVK